jgi:hypothetical protein
LNPNTPVQKKNPQQPFTLIEYLKSWHRLIPAFFSREQFPLVVLFFFGLRPDIFFIGGIGQVIVVVFQVTKRIFLRVCRNQMFIIASPDPTDR